MAEIKKIPARQDIPVEDTWNLADLYENDQAWEAELATLDADREALASYAGHLADSGESLYSFLSAMEAVNEKCGKLAVYTMRKGDEDTRVGAYQAMTGKFMGIYTAMGATMSFETPEIMTISDETLNGFYAQCPSLEKYRRYLTNLRRMKDHVLSEAEEKLLAASGEMSDAPYNIYGMFANADLTFRDALDSQGNAHTVSQGTFVTHQESSDRTLRKNAYESLYDGFGAFKNTAAGLLNAQNKQLKFYADARRYPDAFTASLDGTNVPTSVYLNLIEAVHKNMDKMHRYVRLRKKLLGVDELHFYDIYTPLIADAGKKYTFQEAKQTVYDALAPLGEDYRKILQQGFDNRWIDV